MRAVRTRRWFVLILILGLMTGCTGDMPRPGTGGLLGQGSKDYWDRQIVKDYQRKTIPVIEEFICQFLADGGGQHYTAEGANELTLYETKTNGCEYMSAVYGAQISASPMKARTITGETIGKAEPKIEQQDNEKDNAAGLSWSDSKNGRLLMLSAHPTKDVSFHFVSGCCPSATKIGDLPPLKGVPMVPFTPQQEISSPSAVLPSS